MAIMRVKMVNSTRPTVEIHPYVQGRLRALPCRDACTGLLLGTSVDNEIHITGFRRVPPNALRQAAAAAGPGLIGFYRVHTPGAPLFTAGEADLCHHTQSLFLLIDNAAAQATVWLHQRSGEPVIETISLDATRAVPDPPSILTTHAAAPRLPWVALALALLLSAASITAYEYWPTAPEPTLTLDLQSRDGELTASWQQNATLPQPPESATLTVREDESEQVMDLTKSFTSHGRAVLHPRARNVVVTLNVHYPNRPRLTRSATYIGFDPIIVHALKPKPEPATPALLAEIDNLRRRNKELLDAVTALRKHFDQ